MLGELLGALPAPTDPDVLVATETGDDAGVYRLDDRRALVQTVDFFTPVVDDPYDFGRVAAANALSDVYAMGGRPLTALAIVCFPDTVLPATVLVDIMRGAQASVAAADASIIGGHSVRDAEIKFGLAVTGTVDPDRIRRNRGALPGDLLVLTKPLGTGIVATALRKGELSDARRVELTETMARLNRAAAESMEPLDVHAATDVTGFGLAGHAWGMARASGASITFHFDRLPLLAGARELAESGFLTRGGRDNAELVRDVCHIDPALQPAEVAIVMDPQTSGGLLVSLPADAAATLIERLAARGERGWIVGEVAAGEAGLRIAR